MKKRLVSVALILCLSIGLASGANAASGVKKKSTPTGGTLENHVWVSNLNTRTGEYNYQVAAKYDKTDHQYIETRWYGEVTGIDLSFNIGGSSSGISIGFSSKATYEKTPERYWQNTKSQKDASYSTNGYLSLNSKGSWTQFGIHNTAKVWGKNLTKPTEVNNRVTIKN